MRLIARETSAGAEGARRATGDPGGRDAAGVPAADPDVGAEGGTVGMGLPTGGCCRAIAGLVFALRLLDSQDSLLFRVGGDFRVRGQEVGTLSLPVAFAFDLDLVCVVRQTVKSALSKNRVIEQRNPLVDVSI